MCMRRRVAPAARARPMVPVEPTAAGAASYSAVQLRRGPRAAHGPSWARGRRCPAEHAARCRSCGVADGVVNQVGPSGTAHGSSELVKAHTPQRRGRPSCCNTDGCAECGCVFACAHVCIVTHGPSQCGGSPLRDPRATRLHAGRGVGVHQKADRGPPARVRVPPSPWRPRASSPSCGGRGAGGGGGGDPRAVQAMGCARSAPAQRRRG
jgi:hypothetical protein